MFSGYVREYILLYIYSKHDWPKLVGGLDRLIIWYPFLLKYYEHFQPRTGLGNF